jgi:hypothetical protein
MSLKSNVKLRANVVKAYTGCMRGIETEARRRRRVTGLAEKMSPPSPAGLSEFDRISADYGRPSRSIMAHRIQRSAPQHVPEALLLSAAVPSAYR